MADIVLYLVLHLSTTSLKGRINDRFCHYLVSFHTVGKYYRQNLRYDKWEQQIILNGMPFRRTFINFTYYFRNGFYRSSK
jgi:hypothetical protein